MRCYVFLVLGLLFGIQLEALVHNTLIEYTMGSSRPCKLLETSSLETRWSEADPYALYSFQVALVTGWDPCDERIMIGKWSLPC